MTRVLVVDDDPQLVRALRINLAARGYDVATALSGEEALREASGQVPDLVILDLGMPGLSGMDIIAGLRGWTDVPIIVLSGRTGGSDKVEALDAGADDYVTKPFGMEELMARIRAITRRSAGADAADDPVVEFGGVRVDLADHRVVRVDAASGIEEAVRLTPTEWHLLEVLLRQPGKLLSQRFLLEEVWGSAYLNQPSNLRLYMTQLRRKLEPDPSHPRYLLTEPGMGYRFLPER
ncbi:response regulator [Nigerium sp.]|uniref:response regulator n=1 Tax=Nigerium sp. TaxID=2042655 RepID=UPI0032215521